MNKPLLLALLLHLLAFPVVAQRGEDPRRIENPETLKLVGGSRVYFESFQAEALSDRAFYSIFLPPSYSSDPDKRFPVVYFLHGLWNDHTSWTVARYGGIPQKLDSMMARGEIPEFVLVHPAGENSFYTDYLDGTRRYEQLVARDLIVEVERRYRIKDGRSARALGGVSMGGYGALKIALKHPEKFGSVAAVSPIVFLGEDPSEHIRGSSSRLAQYLVSALEPVFGMPFDREHWKQNSLEVLAETQEAHGLEIFFAFGTADRYAERFPLEAGIRRFSQILERRGIDHELKIYPGGPHGWRLVVEHFEEIIGFLTRSF